MRITVAKILPTVADSWESLRPCDVDRLVSACRNARIPKLGIIREIAERRPDLADEAAECVAESC